MAREHKTPSTESCRKRGQHSVLRKRVQFNQNERSCGGFELFRTPGWWLGQELNKAPLDTPLSLGLPLMGGICEAAFLLVISVGFEIPFVLGMEV